MEEQERPPYPLRDFKTVLPVDHMCAIFRNEEEQVAVLAEFIRIGLTRNERVYMCEPDGLELKILAQLADMDIQRYIEKKQLLVQYLPEFYEPQGKGDNLGEMICNKFKTAEEAALRDGFIGVRQTAEPITCDPTVEDGLLVGADVFVEYEALLNEYIPKSAPNTIFLCQYRLDRWHHRFLRHVLTVHPFAVVGRELYHNFYYIPFPEFYGGKDRSAVRLQWWLRNLQERKTTEEALIFAKEEAIAASSAKSVFLATVSHEIRTPLTGIVGMTDLLLDNAPDKEQQNGLEIIKACAGHLLHVINDVIDSAHMESGRLVLNNAPFNLAECISDVIAVCKVPAQTKQLVLRSALSTICPTFILGDALRLRQVLINLVGNAVKFSNHEGEIVLSCHIDPYEEHPESQNDENALVLRFSVSDQGIGIAREDIPKLFQQFSQVDQLPRRQFGGSGLGLSISKRLVEMVGGRIWVKSIVNVGSKFSFTYPTKRATESVSLASAERARPGDFAHLSLLVAEDNLTNQMLSKYGCKVRLVSNGAEACEAVAAEKFSLILMDMHMPVMDGWEAVCKIKREAPAEHQAPIYAMTAGTLGKDTEGFDGFLVKPFTLRDLETLLAKHA